MWFLRKKRAKRTYDDQRKKPMIHASICTGEQAAGFKDLCTGKFEEVMLIRSDADLQTFREMYDIKDEIDKEW